MEKPFEVKGKIHFITFEVDFIFEKSKIIANSNLKMYQKKYFFKF